MIHPEPLGPAPLLLPFFLPYAGCKRRCIFCAQDKQTGVAALGASRLRSDLELELARLRTLLCEERVRQRQCGEKKLELAFFGGTFTALPKDMQLKFLAVASEFRLENKGGFLSAVRCSTRPDSLGPNQSGADASERSALVPDAFRAGTDLPGMCVKDEPDEFEPSWLLRLKNAGLDLIELGIQSFADTVLSASGRGYSGSLALRACRMVKAAGLRLGVQLLPGLPGQTPGMFINDMELVRELAPECLRLYPCQVVDGSELAQLWRQGAYTPWDLDLTVELLSLALLMAWGRGIRVIRMGLAPEPGLDSAILAGPRHPALGQMARSKALWRFIRLHLLWSRGLAGKGASTPRLYVPERYQGEIFGYANNLLPGFMENGLERQNIIFWDAAHFTLRWELSPSD